MGEVFCRLGRYGVVTECGYRTRLVGVGVEWHKHCVSEDLSPSSVAYGATFPLEGEGFRKFC